MKNGLKIIFVAFGILFISTGIGQNIRDSIIYAPIFNVSYSGQLPGGDMKDRFGFNSNIGVSGGIKTDKNWQFELEGTFIFSQAVKDTNILDGLRTTEGYILNAYGEPANILVQERGFTGTFNIGKFFPVIGPNLNSGLIAKFGLGFLRHKIRIDNQGSLVPELSPDNLVYYDRLTLGIVTKQYFGYQHMSSNNLANFNFGIELSKNSIPK